MMYHNVSNNLQIHYEWKYALTASIAALICTVGATILSCPQAGTGRNTGGSDASAASRKRESEFFWNAFRFLWKHLNFTWKSSLRNLFRYKKTTFYDNFRHCRQHGTDAGRLWDPGFHLRYCESAVQKSASVVDGTIIADDDAARQIGIRRHLFKELDQERKTGSLYQNPAFQAHCTEWKGKFKCICLCSGES